MSSAPTRGLLADLLRELERPGPLIILPHDNPDPDSMASAVALKFLAHRLLEKETYIALGGIVGRAENGDGDGRADPGGDREQPGRAQHEQVAQVAPAVAPGAQVRGTVAQVGYGICSTDGSVDLCGELPHRPGMGDGNGGNPLALIAQRVW